MFARAAMTALLLVGCNEFELVEKPDGNFAQPDILVDPLELYFGVVADCLLYTSPSPRD